MACGIAMLEDHVRMSLQEGYHMREEDVFPVTHSVTQIFLSCRISRTEQAIWLVTLPCWRVMSE
jgi:hypothetical protein